MPHRVTFFDDGSSESVFESSDGTPFIDYITGEQTKGAGDVLRGFSGDDQLTGFAGNDRLNGGDGADWLNGGPGRDILKGGTGFDFFTYDVPKDGRDIIKDFTPGEDLIQFIASEFIYGPAGLRQDHIGRLWYDQDGAGCKEPKLIARLNVEIDLSDDVIFS